MSRKRSICFTIFLNEEERKRLNLLRLSLKESKSSIVRRLLDDEYKRIFGLKNGEKP